MTPTDTSRALRRVYSSTGVPSDILPNSRFAIARISAVVAGMTPALGRGAFWANGHAAPCHAPSRLTTAASDAMYPALAKLDRRSATGSASVTGKTSMPTMADRGTRTDGTAQKHVIAHADDIGMCHGANTAFAAIAGKGFITSGSVMVPCPWF